MANPLSSVKDFFGWNGNNTGAPQPDRSTPSQSTVSSITNILSGGQGRRGGYQSMQGAIVTLDVQAYSDAKQIAESFREGASVIVHMTEMSELDQRRMVDFMGGLKEGLQGRLSRIAPKVFLLVPSHVPTNAEEGEQDDFGPADGLVINPMR